MGRRNGDKCSLRGLPEQMSWIFGEIDKGRDNSFWKLLKIGWEGRNNKWRRKTKIRWSHEENLIYQQENHMKVIKSIIKKQKSSISDYPHIL